MSSRVGSRKDCGAGMGEVLPPVSAAPGFGHVCCSTASLQRHGNLKRRKKKTPSKHPIDFAQKQLSRTFSSPVKALRLVCNAIISSAIAAVQLSEHISKRIAGHSALVHTGAPAVMRTPLLPGHTQNRAAGEQWHRIERKFPSLSLVGFLLFWIWSQKTSKSARWREKWELLGRVEKLPRFFCRLCRRNVCMTRLAIWVMRVLLNVLSLQK